MVSRRCRDALPGGVAKGLCPDDFNPKVLRQGTLVELEHTGDWRTAEDIAMDHIREAGTKDSRGRWTSPYYDELAKMEQRIEANPTVELAGQLTSPAGMALGNPGGDYLSAFWAIASLASAGASAYHGYKRNQSVGWAFVWGVAGGVFPIIVPVIAYAQGFAEPAQE